MTPPSAEPREKRLSIGGRRLIFALVALFVLLIVLASWAPDSQMTKLPWIPGWIAQLADRAPNLRTAVPFMPLAGLLFLGLSAVGLKRPLLSTLTICGVILCLSEFGQTFLPNRTVDWKDLLWGTVGILLGVTAAKLLGYYRRKFLA